MTPDFLVVGAGVAGLSAAVELSKAGEVLVVSKQGLEESSSQYAQGGVAVALGEDDRVQLHEQDTISAGAGLCDRDAVHVLVEEGVKLIQQLIEWGAEFDHDGPRLALGREGAHSRSRVLHAHGDSTGREISRALYHKVSSLKHVHFRSFSAITDLLVEDGEVVGAVACEADFRRSMIIHAKAVLMATGGLGRLYRSTTNPEVATGDGVAAAYHAGAEISDIEFVQFHPTALDVEGAPPFLLSEAIRGEGARLINSAGEPFMSQYHAMAELAPRDVVSRAIVTEMRKAGTPHVFLDLTPLGADFIRNRFPTIHQTCLEYGVDITRERVPVHPAAHYAMGGIRTDLSGKTSLARLYAAGEVACTGVHGANRLASNSLLEGIVFGARAGAAMQEWAGSSLPELGPQLEPRFPLITAEELRGLASEKCGIVRCGKDLEEICDQLERTPKVKADKRNPALIESRNIHTVISLIARCALAREESRGAHYRTDFPEARSEFQKHSLIARDNEVKFF